VRFFAKIKIKFFNPKTLILISLLNGLIQDHSDHGAQRNQRIHCGQIFFGSMDASQSFLDLRIQSWIFPKKSTHGILRQD